MKKSAVISSCGLYRYRLERHWDGFKRGTVGFMMLNPSTADAEQDDPTIRKCIGFAQRWGFGGLIVVNQFAYRATDPKALKRVADPVGPENETHIFLALENCDRMIVAWGANATAQPYITNLLRQTHRNVEAFQPLTKSGQPPHPLMLAYSTPTDSWVIAHG